MHTIKDVLEYIDIAFSLSSMPDTEVELKSILTEVVIGAAQIPVSFLNENFAQKVKMLTSSTKPGEEKFKLWSKNLNESNTGYYINLVMTFLRAYATVEAKSHPDKVIVNKVYQSMEEILQDRMDIDNDPEMNKLFVPFLKHVHKVTPAVQESPKNTELYFRSNLKPNQRKTLVQELKEQNYTKAPQQLMNFLAGNNEASFVINKAKEYHMAYLLFILISKEYISISKGSGFFKHFESHYGIKMGNNGMAELKRQVLDKKYNKRHVQQEVGKIIERL